MKTPHLDKAYNERTWTHLSTYTMGDPEENIPPTTSSGMSVYSLDSPFAADVERGLAAGGTLSPNTFIFDVELIATGEDHSLTAGGSVDRLSEDYQGHPAGSLIMSVYERSDEDRIMIVWYVESTTRKS